MTTPKSKPAPLPTTPPDLSGRVWAAWAFETEDEARRAAAFLNGAEDEGGVVVLSQGTRVKQTDPDADEEDDSQGMGWETSDPGARADVYKDPSTPLAPWRMVWSCEAEPALSDTLEGAEDGGPVEYEMWLSPFELGYAMTEAGLDEPTARDPKTGRDTGEAYDFGQPDRARPFQGATEEKRAKALAAAAPELLEALKEALAAAKDRRPAHVGRLEAVIAKAEGRA